MSTRISTAQLFRSGHENIASAREKHTQSTEKSSTGKEINRPSQNPGGWTEANHIKDDLSIRNAVVGNVNLALRSMAATENVFSDIQSKIERLREIAVQCAGTDGASEQARIHNLSEAQHLFEGLIQNLNTKYANRTLFAGAKTDGLAFDDRGKYLGDNQVQEIEIERGVKMPIGVSALDAIMGEGSRDGINIIELFSNVVTGIRNNSAEEVFAHLGDLPKAGDQISIYRSELAGRVNRLENTLTMHAEKSIESQDSVSKIEDADAVKVFSDLARDQTTLNAAMTTTQKVLQESPVDKLFR